MRCRWLYYCIFLFSLFLFLSYLALNDLEEMTLIYLNVLFLFFLISIFRQLSKLSTIIIDSMASVKFNLTKIFHFNFDAEENTQYLKTL